MLAGSGRDVGRMLTGSGPKTDLFQCDIPWVVPMVSPNIAAFQWAYPLCLHFRDFAQVKLWLCSDFSNMLSLCRKFLLRQNRLLLNPFQFLKISRYGRNKVKNGPPRLSQSERFWPKLARSDQNWPVLTKTGPFWPKLTRSDQNWPVLTKTEPFWPKLTRSDQNWPVLTKTEPFWPKLTRSDQNWPGPNWPGNIKPWSIISEFSDSGWKKIKILMRVLL